MSASFSLDAIQSAQIDFNLFTINSQNGNLTTLQTPSGSVSMLDLKAPGKAQHEYTKGYQLLLRKDFEGAVQHLTDATAIYPKFVAAHNALGTAYLELGKNEQARDEFKTSVTLDDHLPNSYLNLGCAHLALKDYSAAEETFRKASSIAPLDLQLQLALTYGQYAAKDYPAVIATANEVHGHKHSGAALVHFFAAGAFDAQGNLTAAQKEIRLLLKEDPKSPSAADFQKILDGLKEAERHRALLKFNSIEKVKYSIGVPTSPGPEVAGQMAQMAFQDMEEQEQITEAEAEPDAVCTDCTVASASPTSASNSDIIARSFGGAVIRSTVDEVSILFAATDHGKSVTNLTTPTLGFATIANLPTRS